MKQAKRTTRRDARRRFEDLSLIGMVHLPALPGSPGANLAFDAVLKLAVAEAKLLAESGFDALIVENFGDTPFAADEVPPETIAAMSIAIDHVVRAVDVPVGVNVLRNDGKAALAIAAATGAAFIRVNVLSGTYATDQGLITGKAHELLRYRCRVAPNVKIAADVHVKHATPISQPDIALAAEETAYRAGADALIVSGAATGLPADPNNVVRVQAAVRDFPVWIGSGITPETVGEFLRARCAVIVGTSLKKGNETTAPIDKRRLREFIRAAARK